MSKKPIKILKEYTHQDLMNRYNELQIRIKVHLFNLGDEKTKSIHPKPTSQELDEITNELFEILQQFSKPFTT